MLIDIPQERGMTKADKKFGIEMKDNCQFPMFSFVHPLNSDYMAILYSFLFLSKYFGCNCNKVCLVIIGFTC